MRKIDEFARQKKRREIADVIYNAASIEQNIRSILRVGNWSANQRNTYRSCSRSYVMWSFQSSRIRHVNLKHSYGNYVRRQQENANRWIKNKEWYYVQCIYYWHGSYYLNNIALLIIRQLVKNSIIVDIRGKATSNLRMISRRIYADVGSINDV